MIDYKKIDLKCGLEIHRQLNTKHKLFCNCSTMMQEKEPIKIIMRKQNPTQSEIGEIDTTAQYEFLRNRNFYYQIFPSEDCLVECDEEPVHPLNQEALEIVLQIALMFNCTIPDEIQIMRKNVIDGSNTSAFQRTAVIGLDGYLEYKGKKIEITSISLEEDAASIVDEKNGNVTYRLNRLGIPLVEIGTGLLIGYSPEEIQEIAYFIGMICRSTGKVKRGIGTVRQDVNVSIKNGARVEIKGIQELGLLSKVIELEVQRQLSLPEVKEETRATNPDGTTRFIRPLPGSARMYVETDIPPILIEDKTIQKIKKNLPEPWTKKLVRFREKLKLSDDLSKQILASDYLDLFENIIKKFNVNPSIVANVFVSTLKDLKKREDVKIENLTDEIFEELFELLDKGKIVKESVPDVLLYKSKNVNTSLEDCIKKIGLETITEKELREIVKDVIKANRDKPSEKIIGIVMSKVRGRVKSEDVIKTVKEEF
ncbi:MAG: Glu-tRNA(Gln) amidotransferase subunit GatE [Candidatus Aenigmarchaeota archaeon]|nr:Glu-tRNA(Gln) amidotransferase subunit GatE [Candidatus Aenigmarchaeota archaeon]